MPVKKILSLKVACLGAIECPKTKKIILNNKIQDFCRELKGRIFQKENQIKRLDIDGDNREKMSPSFILSCELSTYFGRDFVAYRDHIFSEIRLI